MKRLHDIEGELYIFPSAESGRTKPAVSGYRPQHKIHDNYQTSGQHEYINSNQVVPGGTVSTKVWLLTPDVYPKSIWIGRTIGVFEGARQVGILTITRIINEVLLGNPETFNPIWVEPAGLTAEGHKIGS